MGQSASVIGFRRGSIDRPRVAVTSFCCTPCCEKVEKAFMVEVPEVKPVPLRRNIAEGFSFDSLGYDGLGWIGEKKWRYLHS